MCLVINEGLKFCFRSFFSNMYNLHIQFKFLDIEMQAFTCMSEYLSVFSMQVFLFVIFTLLHTEDKLYVKKDVKSHLEG